MTVGRKLFVAGGESRPTRPLKPGLGATQLGPGESSAGTGGDPGAPPTLTVSTIWAFNPAAKRLLPAGHLQVPVSHAAVAVAGTTAWIIGGESNGALVASVQMLRANRAFGTAGAAGAGSPFYGAKLLIADRGNNRVRVSAATTGTVYGQAMTAGNVYTVAGTGTLGFSGDGGPATAADINAPLGVVAGSGGSVLFSDAINNRIRMVSG